MSQSALPPHEYNRSALMLAPKSKLLFLGIFAAVLLSGAIFVPDPMFGVVMMGAGFSLGFVMLANWVFFVVKRRANKQTYASIAQFVAHDASPSFVTDNDGEVDFLNAAAEERFSDIVGHSMTRALADLFANPGAVLFRLQNRANAVGSAREDVVTRRGHIRLAVHQISQGQYLWRLEDMGEKIVNGRGAEGLSLPMITASKSGTILFMNDAMRNLLGGRAKTLDRVFNDLPVKNGHEHEIASKNGPLRAFVAELGDRAGRREIYLLPALSAGIQADGWQFFDGLPVPLIKIAPDGQIVQANRLARALLNDPMAPDTNLGELVEGLGRSVVDWLNDMAQGRGINHSEVLRARKAEKEVYLQVTLSQIEENGTPMLIAVLNDATELKTLEAQFVQSQKMQAIGQLAGGVAHDFNNLLTAISGHCDLLMLRHDQGDPDFADLIQISQNTNRAASLVGQLLAFSRKQNLQPETLDLRDILMDLTHLLNRLVGEKIKLTFSHDPDNRAIRADKRQLEQVLMNLVVNARDAMPEGGGIIIDTKAKTLTEELKRDRATVPAGDYIVVTVKDTGTGISPDKLPKIFEPFFTTKKIGEGTGLGLSTVYGITKQSGGYVFVDSIVGQGTCFSLYFPECDLDEVVVAAPVEKKMNNQNKQGEGVILLVEDEAPVRAFASRALRLRGYTVLEADCAEDALETLEDTDLTIDLFVTDVIMPGMDGPSWVKKALVDRPDVKVVFVSGYAEDDFSDNQSKIPNSVFLPKPFSLSDLTDTVHDQLH